MLSRLAALLFALLLLPLAAPAVEQVAVPPVAEACFIKFVNPASSKRATAFLKFFNCSSVYVGLLMSFAEAKWVKIPFNDFLIFLRTQNGV